MAPGWFNILILLLWRVPVVPFLHSSLFVLLCVSDSSPSICFARPFLYLFSFVAPISLIYVAASSFTLWQLRQFLAS